MSHPIAIPAGDVVLRCAKCSEPAKRTYNCDHTDYEEYCKECYTELHYYLTEEQPAADGTAVGDEPGSKNTA